MADINEIYGGSANNLSTKDVPKGKFPEFTIGKVTVKQYKKKDGTEESKLVLILSNGKDFILNKTNAQALASNFGSPDYNTWEGKSFKVFNTTTNYGGAAIDCLRVV